MGEVVREPHLQYGGIADSRHLPVIMSIAKAAPTLQLLCPRCERRYRIEELEADHG